MNVPSENILKLIELTDRLCLDDNDKILVIKLKKIVEYGKLEVSKARTIKNKIKCYEVMVNTITNILNKHK